jgi:hypothetical protein
MGQAAAGAVAAPSKAPNRQRRGDVRGHCVSWPTLESPIFASPASGLGMFAVDYVFTFTLNGGFHPRSTPISGGETTSPELRRQRTQRRYAVAGQRRRPRSLRCGVSQRVNRTHQPLAGSGLDFWSMPVARPACPAARAHDEPIESDRPARLMPRL